MNLGDVTRKTVPKMCLASPPRNGGAIATRNFIPHTVHKAIGVFGAVSVATACVVPGSVTANIAHIPNNGRSRRLDVEHPTGFFTVDMDIEINGSQHQGRARRVAAHGPQNHGRRSLRPHGDLEGNLTWLQVERVPGRNHEPDH